MWKKPPFLAMRQEARQPPHCINCGKGGHPASYSGCEAAPKHRSRTRKPYPDAPEKSTLNKLVQAIFKALTIKDFFTEAQLAFLAKELEGKPEKADASTQTDSSEQPSTEAFESDQPEPMEATLLQAPPPDLEQATPLPKFLKEEKSSTQQIEEKTIDQPQKIEEKTIDQPQKIEEKTIDEFKKRIADRLEQICKESEENS